jgi:DNA-binding transcriptional ArsR family regulator
MQSIANFCHTPQTRQDGLSEAITPESIQRAGFTPIPTYPGRRSIASCWKPGYDIDVAAGLQADGTWLHLLDLDSHTPEQDAASQLARIRRRLGPDLSNKLAIRLSRSGRGYHIIYRTATPHSQHASIKVFDPLQPDRHIGELIGPGMRVTLTGTWLQGSPEAIPLLTAKERDLLCAAIHTPALYGPQVSPGSPQSAPGEHTARKDRMAEGMELIAGWEQVTDVQQRLERLAQSKEKVERHLRQMRRTPRNRSDAYSQLVQCLMYHATGLGRDLYERCRTVAAMAIHIGAAGKERERTYKIINDTAALIARIIHGDAFLNDPDRHFGIPRWVNTPEIPARPALTTQPQPAQRTAHPHARDRQKNIKRLLRILRKLPIREYGKRYISLDELAEWLGLSRRTIQDYLKELRERGIIHSGQDGGNGPLYIIIIEPPTPPKDSCRHAGSAKLEPHTAVENLTERSAEVAPDKPIATPENSDQHLQCSEELGAPKGSAPTAALLAPGPVEVAPALADEQAELVGASDEALEDLASVSGADYVPLADDQADAAGASFVPLADNQAVVYEPVYDQAKIASASYERADDQADSSALQDELLSGAELAGPAGALIVVGGAAYVPADALPWYAGICAALVPVAPDQADEVAGAAQLTALFDADDQAVSDEPADELAVSIEVAGRPARRRRRSRKDPIQKKLDERRKRVEGWRAMDLTELTIERSILEKASQDRKRPPQQRQLFADMLPQIDVEIGRKRDAGVQAMYQASGNGTELPPSVEQPAPAPVPGVVRRKWQSAFVPFDTPTEALPLREVEPRTHPIAELGTDPESMRAAHEYCQAVLARSGESVS